MRFSNRNRAADITVLAAAVVFALAVRGPAPFLGLAVLALVFVPLERRLPLRRQRTLRSGLSTDLVHLLVNNVLVTVAAIGFAMALSLPLLWARRLDIESSLPTSAAIALALCVAFVGNYWGHRLGHTVPLLWRFHSVHHSIAQMDWLASGRLHPLDSALTQSLTIAPLLVLGYGGGTLAGATVVVVVIALFQHANTRLRLPVVRWVVNTPEWHHWHHSTDDAARDKNFGLPIVDLVFGTAYLPKGVGPSGFGTTEPVPQDSYLRQMAYPFTSAR